jgi:hypothetical protein
MRSEQSERLVLSPVVGTEGACSGCSYDKEKDKLRDKELKRDRDKKGDKRDIEGG